MASLPASSASVTSVGAVIKYLGSKRRLVPVLGELCERAAPRTALDLFTGTTRVAQEFKRLQGIYGFSIVDGNRSPEEINAELQQKIEAVLTAK